MPIIEQADAKNINYQNIYRIIYAKRRITKQQICNELRLSRPTVTQNLNMLLKAGKIYINGKLKGESGRPAFYYHFNEKMKTSVGVEILVEKARIAAFDLDGNTERQESIHLAFTNSDSYFERICKWIESFIQSLNIKPENVLGISIAFQGIIGEDSEHVVYGKLLSGGNFTKKSFSSHLNFPVSLEHDSEMAAIAEGHFYNEIENGILLSLNPYMGSGIIVNHAVLHTPNLSSGTIEHVMLYPGGNLCYCGKRGCADTYVSANSLEQRAGENLTSFFYKLRNADEDAQKVWNEYLHNLALLIDDVRMVFPCDIILGGILSEYLQSEDIEQIQENVQSISAFNKDTFNIYIGHYGKDAALVGVAQKNIDEYLKDEGLV